jgi:hypothetical protein
MFKTHDVSETESASFIVVKGGSGVRVLHSWVYYKELLSMEYLVNEPSAEPSPSIKAGSLSQSSRDS